TPSATCEKQMVVGWKAAERVAPPRVHVAVRSLLAWRGVLVTGGIPPDERDILVLRVIPRTETNRRLVKRCLATAGVGKVSVEQALLKRGGIEIRPCVFDRR